MQININIVHSGGILIRAEVHLVLFLVRFSFTFYVSSVCSWWNAALTAFLFYVRVIVSCFAGWSFRTLCIFRARRRRRRCRAKVIRHFVKLNSKFSLAARTKDETKQEIGNKSVHGGAQATKHTNIHKTEEKKQTKRNFIVDFFLLLLFLL